jgi:RimJ/RimL family protein N-acetyltransferase
MNIVLREVAVGTRSIVLDGDVVGHLATIERFGKPEVSFWIDRGHWGKGLATKALSAFLREVKTRPIYARAATDNIASIRVLEKCGFKRAGKVNAYGAAAEEAILVLVDDRRPYDQ